MDALLSRRFENLDPLVGEFNIFLRQPRGFHQNGGYLGQFAPSYGRAIERLGSPARDAPSSCTADGASSLQAISDHCAAPCAQERERTLLDAFEAPIDREGRQAPARGEARTRQLGPHGGRSLYALCAASPGSPCRGNRGGAADSTGSASDHGPGGDGPRLVDR